MTTVTKCDIYDFDATGCFTFPEGKGCTFRNWLTNCANKPEHRKGVVFRGQWSWNRIISGFNYRFIKTCYNIAKFRMAYHSSQVDKPSKRRSGTI